MDLRTAQNATRLRDNRPGGTPPPMTTSQIAAAVQVAKLRSHRATGQEHPSPCATCVRWYYQEGDVSTQKNPPPAEMAWGFCRRFPPMRLEGTGCLQSATYYWEMCGEHREGPWMRDSVRQDGSEDNSEGQDSGQAVKTRQKGRLRADG